MCAIPKKSSSANKLEIRDLSPAHRDRGDVARGSINQAFCRHVDVRRHLSKLKTDKKYRDLAPAHRDLGVVARDQLVRTALKKSGFLLDESLKSLRALRKFSAVHRQGSEREFFV